MIKRVSYVLLLNLVLASAGPLTEHKRDGGLSFLYKRAAPGAVTDEHGHEEGATGTCPVTEHILTHEFNELAEELSITGPDGVVCFIEDEDHHENETMAPEVPANLTSNFTCGVMYEFVNQLLVRLNLTTECCLKNGTMCDANEPTTSTRSRTSPAQAYGYGFLMVILVSACSLLGVFFIPFVKKNSKFGRYYKYFYALMIALGASALFCDAVLHLIPEALGLHDHEPSADEHGHAEGEEEEDQSFIWKGCVIIGGTYFFLLFEIVLHAWNSHQHSHGVDGVLNSDDHSDSTPEPEGQDKDSNGSAQNGNSNGEVSYNRNKSVESNKLLASKDGGGEGTKKNDGGGAQVASVCLEPTMPHGQCRDSNDSMGGILHPVEVSSSRESTPPSKSPSQNCFKRMRHYILNIKPLAWLIIFGDAIHNFADGLALGAAISQSLSLGLSTMIALVFHEIPHEIGDFVILLSTGMKWYVALSFNFVSALTAIVGFFVGVAISTQSSEANSWILALAAGVFLYIALVDLLPELIHTKEKGCTRWGLFLMANIGFVISFVALLLLALFEEQLNSLVNL